MLELKNIVKDYVSGNNVTHALKGISINFRKNEFVSILGASGCGKTTTLNIVGGLDRYTSGDLIIKGKSTKDYSDRDWDTYRNHSIGFVFQSYNLISHQNILKNVELALTISGVSRAERKQRAMKALEIVGLAGMEKKKPNQLSGGQCQRVAIARALINNPEIVLADEPTGALDSETSIQIMDLLKEVAKDRLVIMVTHNPDLANKYSTRIITMSDGVLLNDTNPFDGSEDKIVDSISKGRKKQSSMSLATSTGLSLSNLASKLKRTILVTIAGSIGIIGVSAVLAVSQGVKDFIADMQNDMLSNYPIGIAEESVDYTSLMTGLNENRSKEALKFDINSEVGVDSMINFLMTAYSDITSVKTNTINEELVDYIDQINPTYAASIYKNYSIDPTNNIFTTWTHDFDKADENKSEKSSDIVSLNGLTQSYIAELQTVNGFKSYASYVNLFTGFMNELPGSESYLLDQYDLIAGSKFATEENEMMLVVDGNTTLTDLLLAEMGVYQHDDFINIAKLAIKKNEIAIDDPERKDKIAALEDQYKYDKTFKFNDLLNREFYYFPQSELYDTSASSKVADDEPYVGITILKMSDAMFIPPDMTTQVKTIEKMYSLQYDRHDKITGSFISMGAGSQIGFDQLDFNRVGTAVKPDINNLIDSVNGQWTATNKDGETITLNFDGPRSAQISIGEEAPETLAALIAPDTKKIYGANYDSFIEQDRMDMINHPENHNGMKMKITGILRLKEDRNFGSLDRGLYFSNKFAEKYMNDASPNSEKGTLTKAFCDYIDNYKANEETQTGYKAYVKFKYIDHSEDDEDGEPAKTHGKVSIGCASALNGDMSSSFSDLFSAITGINYLEQDSVHLRAVSGLKTVVSRNEDESITDISYKKLPKSISIYPNDFETKNEITKHLDKWNSETESITVFKGTAQEKVLTPSDPLRDELTYSDTIEIIIAVITTFIDAITIALVVFTSLSLVVSCFMIAVITYISVVERIKEIGIIRSLGGRKGDVASLFIMENLLTGLFSGGFGIGITYILQIILNVLLKAKYGIMIANLTPGTALVMIGVSILLSVLSGFIPSQSAAHKDPVVALRSNE